MKRFNLAMLFGAFALLAPMNSDAQVGLEIIDFSAATSRINIDTSQPNSWQIGIPSKATFDSAYAGSRAILTDTLNPYPVNDSSVFTLDFEIYGGQPMVSFDHRMQSAAGRDGGYVELSLDQGSSWLLLNDTTYRMFLPNTIYGLEVWNLYTTNDSLYKGPIGFSGSDSGWIHTQIYFPCMAIKTSWPMKLRFTFVSDSLADNLDGWMLDYFVIDNTGICSGIEEFSSLPKLKAFPVPTSGIVRIKAPEFYPRYESQILNNVGQLVMTLEHPGGTNLDINAETLESGIYHVLLTSEGKPVGAAQILVR